MRTGREGHCAIPNSFVVDVWAIHHFPWLLSTKRENMHTCNTSVKQVRWHRADGETSKPLPHFEKGACVITVHVEPSVCPGEHRQAVPVF